jgi:hypothetical protein
MMGLKVQILTVFCGVGRGTIMQTIAGVPTATTTTRIIGTTITVFVFPILLNLRGFYISRNMKESKKVHFGSSFCMSKGKENGKIKGVVYDEI